MLTFTRSELDLVKTIEREEERFTLYSKMSTVVDGVSDLYKEWERRVTEAEKSSEEEFPGAFFLAWVAYLNLRRGMIQLWRAQ